jgi:hypothetical protein
MSPMPRENACDWDSGREASGRTALPG